ncbi:hypothetical protein GEOBRER4_n2823 [Citrifermentans bremense]|uniref:Dynamin N-terminal domain-containing protein n=1 Tax=Citrifermentans bremense TaxID=60035 RepID=A0A6S6M930_9BACT|nr:dynamin family protein [Citrifermentans bremense]BCG47965.1 hypothetical protein GEOBRER4_n2823 [Citrifermentans bremense]
MDLDKVMELVPEKLRESADALCARTLHSGEALKVCLVGAFSSGKSSLINTLIGENILPTALEETTALPTFIEYGEELAMQLVNQSMETTPLTVVEFQQYTIAAPEGAAFTLLKLPQPWLQGLLLIDLPGLGGSSEEARSYTLAQIRLADVLVYMIPARGPASEDLETLAEIGSYGKRIKIVVSHWDEVEAAAAAGQQVPDLSRWAEHIQQGAGLKTVRLEGVSRFGHGKEAVLEFLARALDDASLIRERRFKAELEPLVRNALDSNLEEQECCSVQGEEAIQALHERLLASKRELIELKTSLYEQQHQDQNRLEQEASLALERIRQGLSDKLEALRAPLEARFSTEQWDAFLKQAQHHSRGAVAEAADALSSHSASYGKINLLASEMQALNLHFPVPEQVEASDFLDLAQLKRLETALTELQDMQKREQQKCDSLPVPLAQATERELELEELRKQYLKLQSTPLPHVIEEITSSGIGSTVGRTVGEIADIALLFVNPTTVASKTASIVGKGAKVVNIAVDAGKVAKTVSKGVKTAKALQYGNKVRPLAEKFGVLEMLSLGYWGEKIGGMFDTQNQALEYIDPEALACQQAALNEIQERMAEFIRQQNRLMDIESERELSGLALEQSRREQAVIAQRIAALKERAEANAQAAKEEAARRHEALRQQETEKAIRLLLRAFEQQTRPMFELLLLRCKQYWQDEVEQTISERTAEIESLTARLGKSPAGQEAELALLDAEANDLRQVLGILAA